MPQATRGRSRSSRRTPVRATSARQELARLDQHGVGLVANRLRSVWRKGHLPPRGTRHNITGESTAIVQTAALIACGFAGWDFVGSFFVTCVFSSAVPAVRGRRRQAGGGSAPFVTSSSRARGLQLKREWPRRATAPRKGTERALPGPPFLIVTLVVVALLIVWEGL